MALQFTFLFHRYIYLSVACFYFSPTFQLMKVSGPLNFENRKSLPPDGHCSPRDVPENNYLFILFIIYFIYYLFYSLFILFIIYFIYYLFIFIYTYFRFFQIYLFRFKYTFGEYLMDIQTWQNFILRFEYHVELI